MSLLDQELAKFSVQPDVAADAFFERCEGIARARGYRIDRRRQYAGPGYDQLNLHLVDTSESGLMIRMVHAPTSKGRVDLDVRSRWATHPVPYDDYIGVVKAAYKQLFDDYAAMHHIRLRLLGIPRRRVPPFDVSKLNCGAIPYAHGKFSEALRHMAIGAGDIRERLRPAFLAIHVIRPEELPPPLDCHLSWIHNELTKRKARYPWEDALDATLAQMKRSSGKRIAERIQAVADAVEELKKVCEERHRNLGVLVPVVPFSGLAPTDK